MIRDTIRAGIALAKIEKVFDDPSLEKLSDEAVELLASAADDLRCIVARNKEDHESQVASHESHE